MNRYCKYCGDLVDLEDWIQKKHPYVCNRCLIDGTHEKEMNKRKRERR